MIKHVSFYDLSTERLVTYEIDSDAYVGTNEKVAAVIDLRMKKLYLPRPTEPKLIINGLSTDSGRGRT